VVSGTFTDSLITNELNQHRYLQETKKRLAVAYDHAVMGDGQVGARVGGSRLSVSLPRALGGGAMAGSGGLRGCAPTTRAERSMVARRGLVERGVDAPRQGEERRYSHGRWRQYVRTAKEENCA
jgi:hypothetical protein